MIPTRDLEPVTYAKAETFPSEAAARKEDSRSPVKGYSERNSRDGIFTAYLADNRKTEVGSYGVVLTTVVVHAELGSRASIEIEVSGIADVEVIYSGKVETVGGSTVESEVGLKEILSSEVVLIRDLGSVADTYTDCLALG